MSGMSNVDIEINNKVQMSRTYKDIKSKKKKNRYETQ